MDSYYLTEEGRARFRRRKIVLETEPPNNDDKMMDYLFGHTSGTVEELVAATGRMSGSMGGGMMGSGMMGGGMGQASQEMAEFSRILSQISELVRGQ